MNDEAVAVPRRSRRGCLIAALVWIVLAAILALTWRFAVQPFLTERLIRATGSTSTYEHEVRCALDGFSGYALLRSPDLAASLAGSGIRFATVDDGADYPARLAALAAGDVDLATFTIDALVATGAASEHRAATIVAVLDETRGADAMVAWRAMVPDTRSLDHPEARIVATPASPSEFLARVCISHFDLRRLGRDWLVAADGPEEVLERLRIDGGNQRAAYVLWEPWVSRALALDGVHRLLDTRNLRGHVVDVLVAGRRVLAEKPEVVEAVVQAYFDLRANHDGDALARLVAQDATTAGEHLTSDQALRLAHTIHWAGWSEQATWFGLERRPGGRRLEDAIEDIAAILVETGALAGEALPRGATALFYDGVVANLTRAGFAPPEPTRNPDAAVVELDPGGWEQLHPVGNLRLPAIVFARGAARLTVQGKRDLARVVELLSAWPGTYLTVYGHTLGTGDAEANRRLAAERAAAVRDALIALGVPARRLRAVPLPEDSPGAGTTTVSFLLGEPG